MGDDDPVFSVMEKILLYDERPTGNQLRKELPGHIVIYMPKLAYVDKKDLDWPASPRQFRYVAIPNLQ